MARYTGPVCRICRAEGEKLFLKGDRCNTGKCAIVRRAYKPGEHGQSRVKMSEYAIRLREKQKLRKIYGIMEKQFRRYYDTASHQKGVTGERLLQLLETRLDNVVFRLGFAQSRVQARQLVLHGHVYVNGHKVNIASYHVTVESEIEVKAKSKDTVKDYIAAESPFVPAWLSSNRDELKGKVLNIPTREEIPVPVKENLVIEFYSR